MNDRDAFMAAIRERPRDDTPRLVFADWLEEQGNPQDAAQAEFIRLQIAIHNNPQIADCEGLSASWCPVCGDCCCPDREDSMDDPKCPLHSASSKHGMLDLWTKRERELVGLDAYGAPGVPQHPHWISDGQMNAISWFGTPSPLSLDNIYIHEGRPALTYRVPSAFNVALGSFHGPIDEVNLFVSRGFPDRASVTWGTWQRYCIFLIGTHPLTNVKLTTWPRLYRSD